MACNSISSDVHAVLVDQRARMEALPTRPELGLPPTRRAPGCPLLRVDTDSSTTFLQRLYNMLEHCPAHIASWSTAGSSFTIYDPRALETNMLPQFLHITKTARFVRQLALYQFKRTRFVDSNGKVSVRYHHSHFVRDDPTIPATTKHPRRRSWRPKTNDSTRRKQLKATLSELVASVRVLQAEIAATKAALLVEHAALDQIKTKCNTVP
ncbi:hypothetical protein H310_06438 [Aphanomyces invadans]|uniref:HSF-type DNA-binding domain-containing protein n=1 Tax=Aphanomyces invadans TaxID=157072 RepID=A0A024U659_9STRA|nr:hypothetical protein H310_06438 [Aphanomyces invadans]ETW01876.1 hypothetical protein H310_06438 [Aphanomyces invadans]|eukprot:XP_008869724.1 hypothetical protein H310_06438 [Aphanomyces invadans]